VYNDFRRRIQRYIFVLFVRELGRYNELRVKIISQDVMYDYKAIELYLVSIGFKFVKFELIKFLAGLRLTALNFEYFILIYLLNLVIVSPCYNVE